jgi:hypothetical protein
MPNPLRFDAIDGRRDDEAIIVVGWSLVELNPAASFSSHGKTLMTATDFDRELKSELEAFETSLATPVVSGELAVWSDHVREAWSTLSPRVCHDVAKQHARQFEEITSQDPELFAQVDKLKADDEAIQAQRQSLDQLVGRLANLAPLVEPDEGKFHALMSQLQKDGVEFIARVRKQLVAVQTWYVEAFNRDRGVAD